MDINLISLAYLGDSVYELYVREYLIEKGINKAKLLQDSSILYVSAKSQAKFLNYLIKNNYLHDIELDIIRRARNLKSNKHPKNTSLKEYKESTGFEAVIGYLYINKNIDRIKEIFKYRKEMDICTYTEKMY